MGFFEGYMPGGTEGAFNTGLVSDIASAIPGLQDALKHREDLEQQGYDRDLTAQIMDREDTAIQRRADDMRAAGINPIMAAGAAAQTGGMARSSSPERGSGGVLDAASLGLTASRVKKQNELTSAQTDLAKASKDKVVADTVKVGVDTDVSSVNLEYLQRSLDSRVAQIGAMSDTAEINTRIRAIDEEIRGFEARGSEAANEVTRLQSWMRHDWLAGNQFIDYTYSDGGGEHTVRIRLDSIRNPAQFELASKELAIALLALQKKHFFDEYDCWCWYQHFEVYFGHYILGGPYEREVEG